MSQQGQATRTAILDAAQASFARVGFRATTLRGVAGQVGVTQPLIHHHFGTKEGLFEAVLARATADFVEAQSAQWDRDPGDVRFFTEGIQVMFAVYGRQREIVRLLLWARLEGRLPEPGATAAIEARIQQKFVDAKAAGLLREEVEVTVARLMIDAVTRNFWDYAELMPALAAHAEPLTDALLDTLLTGLLTAPALAEARAILAEERRARGR